MPPKVFVGNINYSTTKDDIVELMSSVGEVRDAYLPVDRETGRPRGFAFVEFATEDEAAEAIQKFNDYEMAGRKLRVNAAEDRPPRRGGPPTRSSRSSRDDYSGGDFDFDNRPEPHSKPKGSRRGLRRKKRSL